MPQTLPYRIKTRTGEVIDFEFGLHEETGSVIRVSQLLGALLETIDREIRVLGETSNGDILQAVAMSLAARARMIHAPLQQTSSLARELLEEALTSAAAARTDGGPVGHA
jgi:DNA-binding transcriptional regulator LsrR (DeoR family)